MPTDFHSIPRLCILFILALCAFLQTPSGYAQERGHIPEFRTYGTADTGDEEAIADLIAEYRRAWGREDVPALMALHTEDTEWTNAFARIIQERAALADFLGRRLFPGFDSAVSKGEADRMKTISVRYMGSEAAVVHLYTDSDRGAARSGGTAMRRVHFHLVLAKEDETWRVAHTAIMDAR